MSAPTQAGPDVSVEVDPRDPALRLGSFFDPGSLELLTDRDDSGMLAARGLADVGPPPASERARTRAVTQMVRDVAEEPGYRLVSADYSQVELRILAHVSGEPKLREAYERGEDVHAATASEVLGIPQAELTKDQRNVATMVNFGIIYGISSFGLSENLGIPREEAQELIDTYLARLPRVQELIKRTIAPGSVVYTDEYDIYHRLPEWGYTHRTVCHASGEFARDDDGDGFCEVHVNTLEGFWSLLRSWLRPHRGIAQEKLPLYLGFFEFVYNVRKRGKALLGVLIELLVT